MKCKILISAFLGDMERLINPEAVVGTPVLGVNHEAIGVVDCVKDGWYFVTINDIRDLHFAEQIGFEIVREGE